MPVSSLPGKAKAPQHGLAPTTFNAYVVLPSLPQYFAQCFARLSCFSSSYSHWEMRHRLSQKSLAFLPDR